MPIELEAKMKVPDLAAVRERLRAAGATMTTRVLEMNTFLDTSEGTLLKRDSGLRLRHTRDLASGDQRNQLTYKGPQESGQLKRREEIEVSVSDADALLVLLGRIGYTPDLSFEKRRETWHLDGCTIELDELPELGTFVEIEGPDESTVMRVREQLQLHHEPLITTSYASMTSEFLKEHPSPEQALRFT